MVLSVSLDVGVAEQHALSACAEVARRHAVDGAFEGVERLKREREHDGVDQGATSETDDQHHRDGRPVEVSSTGICDVGQREPGAQPDADQDDDHVGHQHLEEQRQAKEGVPESAATRRLRRDTLLSRERRATQLAPSLHFEGGPTAAFALQRNAGALLWRQCQRVSNQVVV
jgi:hypothetical protein